jgi:hypothetical protein
MRSLREASPLFFIKIPLPQRGRGTQGDGVSTTVEGFRKKQNVLPAK